MAEHFDREDVEAVIAQAGDDAAQLRQENDEDERAENMDRAASMLTWMLLTHPAYAPGVRVDAPVSRDSLPMGWNVAVEMSRQTPRTGQVVLDCAVVLKVDERLTNGVTVLDGQTKPLSGADEYSARECVEYAISCLKNRDSRDCTINCWLKRVLAQMPGAQDG